MAQSTLAGRQILIVEDNYLLAKCLQEELEDLGAKIVGPVPSVELGLALANFSPLLDGAVLDVALGHEKVFPVADALMIRGIPIVFATGFGEQAIPSRYAHISRCQKPTSAKEIARALG